MKLTFNDNENSSIICIEINLNTDSYVKKYLNIHIIRNYKTRFIFIFNTKIIITKMVYQIRVLTINNRRKYWIRTR